MSLLNGEWWIDGSGYATYADGDIGDTNHEIEAFNSAIGLDLDSAPFEISPNTLSWEDAAEAFLEDSESEYDLASFGELSDKEQEELYKEMGVPKEYWKEGYEEALFLAWYENAGANMEFVRWCREGSCDARDWALEHEGWIRVAGDNFQCWKLDDDTLNRIQEFLNGELDENDIDLVKKNNHEFGVEEMSTNWYESIPLFALMAAKTGEGLKRYGSSLVGKFHRKGDDD